MSTSSWIEGVMWTIYAFKYCFPLSYSMYNLNQALACSHSGCSDLWALQSCPFPKPGILTLPHSCSLSIYQPTHPHRGACNPYWVKTLRSVMRGQLSPDSEMTQILKMFTPISGSLWWLSLEMGLGEHNDCVSHCGELFIFLKFFFFWSSGFPLYFFCVLPENFLFSSIYD